MKSVGVWQSQHTKFHPLEHYKPRIIELYGWPFRESETDFLLSLQLYIAHNKGACIKDFTAWPKVTPDASSAVFGPIG